MKPTCLVTGINGLLGTHLLPLLKDYEVFAIFKDNVQMDLPHHCQCIQTNLNDPNFETLLPNSIDAIIHLAQSNHYKEFPKKSHDIASINTMSTLRLLEYGRHANAKSFIFASTGSIYGMQSESCKEDEPLTLLQKQGFYYASKLAGELFVENYSSYMTTVILRFFFIYGPGQRSARLIPNLVQSIKNHHPISLQGPNGLMLNPTYVSDAAQAIRASLKLKESATINIAGPDILSLREIGETIGKNLGLEALFEQHSAETPLFVGDIAKMQALLLTPQVHFKDGIQAYIESLEPQTVRT